MPTMKKIRIELLSVLLFAFTFFIVHDYVIVHVDSDTQYELCYAQNDTAVMDLPSQIHHDIHTLSALPDAEWTLLASQSLNSRPVVEQFTPYTTSNTVPQRPPLS